MKLKDFKETVHVIPDHTGGICVGFYGNGSEPTTFHRQPILAWAVMVVDDELNTITMPVLCSTLSDNPWCIEQRVGETTTWDFPECACFDTFEAALAYATEQLLGNELMRQRKMETR